MGESASLNSLPHGADGIEIGDFAIQFCKDKVIAFKRTAGDHFTIHAGTNSGVIDIHRTWRDPSGCEQHTTIFAMRRDSIPALLDELSSLPSTFTRLLRHLRLGWLGHRRIWIAWGVWPIDPEHISRVTRRKPGRKRLVFDTEQILNEIDAPDYLEDVWARPDGPFSLVKDGQIIGIAFKATDPHGNGKLAWIKLRHLGRLANQMGALIVQVALRHAIPESEYHKYSLLRGGS